MKIKDKQKLLLVFLFLVLFAVNYPFLDKVLKNWLVDYEIGVVERVIDGDTLVVNGTSIRLLGINTPEKGDLYSSEAERFLENSTLNKLVKMEQGKQDLDLYKRRLRYIFVDGENVNLKLVENGLANPYFPEGKDRHYNEFFDAWKTCINDNVNLCEKSKNECASCISIKEFDVKGQKIVFSNKCSFSCSLKGWTIKDEGRKVFTFSDFSLNKEIVIKVGDESNTGNILYWKDEDYVWTNTGDTLFLRDDKGKLVLWKKY